jgi:hypothetical protein
METHSQAPRATVALFSCALTIALGVEVAAAREIPKSELIRLTSTDPGSDRFGASIAAYGRTLVVGAPFNDGTGAAYVFVRNSANEWVQQAKLVSPDGGEATEFGARVAVSVDTAVVASHGSDRAAHVFVRSGSTWTRRQRLELTGNPQLEIAVDGHRLILVSHSSGNAFAYRRNTSTQRWAHQATLRPDSGHPGFTSVQMSDRMAVLGATRPGAVSEAGSAYVFAMTEVTGQPDRWTRSVRLHPTGHDTDTDLFGSAVDIGQGRVLVGSMQEGAFFNGAAYFFERQPNGAWQQTHRFTARLQGGPACFGESVVLYRDRAIVTRPCFRDTFNEDQISVELFARDAAGAWSHQDLIRDPQLVDARVALSTCGAYIGVPRDDAAYVLPEATC